MSTPNIFTVDETAKYLKLSRGQIFALIRTGELGSYKIGRCRRIGIDHVNAYLRTVENAGGDAA
jgi:excisionase family DNA binding protein